MAAEFEELFAYNLRNTPPPLPLYKQKALSEVIPLLLKFPFRVTSFNKYPTSQAFMTIDFCQTTGF